MNVKWQIPIGEDVLVPFERKIYSVGLLSIVLFNREPTKTAELLHICLQPHPTESDLWLNDSRVLYSVRSFGVGKGRKDIALNWCGSDIEYYKMDLSPQTTYIKMGVVNNAGKDVNLKGFCLFDVRE